MLQPSSNPILSYSTRDDTLLNLCQGILDSEDKLTPEVEDTAEDDFSVFINFDPDPDPVVIDDPSAAWLDSAHSFNREPSVSCEPWVPNGPPDRANEMQQSLSVDELLVFLGLDSLDHQASATTATSLVGTSQSSSPLSVAPIDPINFPLSLSLHQQQQLQQWPDEMLDQLFGMLKQKPAGTIPTEDKRRRNNAASARFRAKKKQREAELEKRVQAMQGRQKDLADRVRELEAENKALREVLLSTQKEKRGEIDGDKSA
ncbi:hypothetical protein B0J12DRAFT_786155 [Macrophomina phaseolina]|uniref:BZIP domain-containing protein n=1 Tax=Macrophomina phaseolina TaxID=35725 RepID=A0ABQ8GAX3_9PEZI|nr:hypothetical protein B0J12DRAFT_786155 [Macrophomina phaseolina]